MNNTDCGLLLVVDIFRGSSSRPAGAPFFAGTVGAEAEDTAVALIFFASCVLGLRLLLLEALITFPGFPLFVNVFLGLLPLPVATIRNKSLP